MRRLLAAAGTLTISFAAACASGAAASGSPSAASATPAGAASASSTAGMRTLSASVASTGATNSRLTGTVTLTPLDASTYSVTIEFRGAPANRALPWAVRPGACGDVTPNTEVGGRSVYSPIQTQADGGAHVNTRLRVALPAQQTLRVDVMASNSQRDLIIGCGVLLGR